MSYVQDIIEECHRMRALAGKQRENSRKMVEEAQIMRIGAHLGLRGKHNDLSNTTGCPSMVDALKGKK